MFFEVFANAIIYRSLSSRLRGKINELKKNLQKAQKLKQAAGNAGGDGAGQGSPGKNGAGALVPVAGGDEAKINADSDDRKPAVVKSSVAHVRESAKFVTNDSSRRGDEKEDIKSNAISW